MNNHRTYGIEMECFAKHGMSEVASLIKAAFATAGINHTVQSGAHYHHNTNQSNRREWEIKGDGSLHNAPNNYPYAMEVVSPVLKGQEGIAALKVVCDVLSQVATVNASCGLHVHHGFDKRNENLTMLARNFYKNENYFYDVLPTSRQHNDYCMRWRDRVVWSDAEVSRVGIETWYHRNIGTRRSGLNLESLSMRNTVEFRMHSASVEFGKVKGWATFTQAFVDAGAAGKAIETENFEAFVSFFEVVQEPVVTEPVVNAQPMYVHPEAKKQKMPKVGTKMAVLVDMLKAGTYTKRQMALKLEELFGNPPNVSLEAQITIHISSLKSLKYGYGARIVEESASRYEASLVKWLPFENNVVRLTGVQFGEEVRLACVWMRERFAKHGAVRASVRNRQAA